MPDWYQLWLDKKASSAERHGKILKRLANAPSKAVNELANSVHEQVFSRIDCLQCANCCRSIPPIVNDTDARRIARHLGVKPAQFLKDHTVIDDDGDQVMNQTPCPFLLSDNTCSIYDIRPKACRRYPHTDEFEFSKRMKLHKTNAQYCPAVFHILEEMERIAF